jgi:hypothetical protein
VEQPHYVIANRPMTSRAFCHSIDDNLEYQTEPALGYNGVFDRVIFVFVT